MTTHIHERTNTRLHAIIATRGLTSAEIAEICKVSVPTVASWRCGQRRMPDGSLDLLELRLGIASAGKEDVA